MQGCVLLVVTVLSLLGSAQTLQSSLPNCSNLKNTTHGLHDGTFTAKSCQGPAGYYSTSPIRPADGVHSVSGYYKPIFMCCVKHTYPTNTNSCETKVVSITYDLSAFNGTLSAFSIQVPRPVVIKDASKTGTLTISLGTFVLNNQNLLVYGTVQSVMYLSNGTYFVNGIPVARPEAYTFNSTLNVTHTSCYESIGAQTWYFTPLTTANAIVEFSSGNVLRSVACQDDSILNSIQCRYQAFEFGTGLYNYDSIVPVQPNRTFIPYPGIGDKSGQSLYAFNVSLRGDSVEYNYTCVNSTLYTYFRIVCNNSYSWDRDKKCIVSDTAYRPGESIYSKGSFKGFIPSYPTCYSKGLSVSSINNNVGFKYFCISGLQETYDLASISSYTCLYITNVHTNDVSSQQRAIRYTFVGVNFEFGDNIYGVENLPEQLIHFNVCHRYDIYNIKGIGAIYNVTDTDKTTLSTGGLAISSGNGLLAFRNNGSLYTVKPCNTIPSQAVMVNNSIVGLFIPVSCEVAQGLLLGNNTTPIDGGCLVTNSTAPRRMKRSVSPVVTGECYGVFATVGSSCIYGNGSVVNRTVFKAGIDTTITPLLGVTANVSIPLTLTLAVTTEYLQTAYQKISIDCARYVCGESLQCRTLLQQYGSFCSSLNNILAGINDNEDNGLLQYAQALNSGYNVSLLNFTGHDVNNLGGFNLSLVVPKISSSGSVSGRSAIEDLLYDKVTTVGVGEVDANYDKCMDSRGGKVTSAADLTCAQYYNGVMVLPGVVDPTLMSLYTASLLGGMAFGGITAAVATPFATQIQARVNYLALTQSVILDNQQLIANSFNKALTHIQSALDTVSQGFTEVARGFETVASSISKMQGVINEHSEILNKLMLQLNVNFGAISSSLVDIYNQLSTLSANAQADRLITGRLSALSTYVASLQLAAYRAEQSRKLALQKIDECVRSQSLRYGFCGNGSHVLTIPQSAPNGMFFIHYTYQPVSYREVEAVPGLCVSTPTGKYGVMPKAGSGIIFRENDTFFVTSRELFQPKLLSYSEVVNLTSCEPNYYNVSENETPFQPTLPSFDEEFENLFTELNTSKDAIKNITTNFNYSIPILNLENEICMLNNSIKTLYNYSYVIDEINQALNDTYINLEQLNKVTRYIKWPWYVWLAIGFACVIFILILGWVFFMTGCCGCCCGCFGIIPLMNKCGKKSSYYTTFDNDVVTEQYRPKKSV